MRDLQPSRPKPIQPNTPVAIPDSEVRFEFSRSGGPGGQNVNKLNTKARVIFDLWQSKSLTSEQKRTVFQNPDVQRCTRADGLIVRTAQEHRTQEMNKKAALAKLNDLIQGALTPEAERIPTDAPQSVEHNRRRDKEARARSKQERRQDYRKEVSGD